MSTVFKPEVIQLSQMSFSKIKQGTHLKNVYIHVDNNKLHIQVPKSRVPFGVSCYESQDQSQPDKKELTISLGRDENKHMIQFLKDLDNHIMEHAKENSEEWFGKKMSDELIKEFYKQSYDQKNPNYPPNFRVKIHKDVNIYDTKRQIQDLSYLDKGDNAAMVVELSGIWISGKRFGVTWRLKQMKVYKQAKLNSYAFIDSEDEDENESE